MRKRAPTRRDIESLVAFLPRLYAEGSNSISEWVQHSGTGEPINMPCPIYAPAVDEFFALASSECWDDYDYVPEQAARMLEDEDFVRRADIDQVKIMLTFCVRGERFCDGHWAAAIERGHIRRLLERLTEIAEEMP